MIRPRRLLAGFALAALFAATAQAESFRLLVSSSQGQLRSMVFTEQGQGATRKEALDNVREKALHHATEVLQGKLDERGLDFELSFLGQEREEGPGNYVFIKSWYALPSSADMERVEAEVEVVYLLTPELRPSAESSQVLTPVPELPLQPAGSNKTKSAESIKKENQKQYDLLEEALTQKLEQLMGKSQ